MILGVIYINLPVELIGDENKQCVGSDDTELTVIDCLRRPHICGRAAGLVRTTRLVLLLRVI